MDININDKVIIKSSNQLSDMRLTDLVYRTGTITDDFTDQSRKNKGYMVSLDIDYMGEENWFIPLESIKKL